MAKRLQYKRLEHDFAPPSRLGSRLTSWPKAVVALHLVQEAKHTNYVQICLRLHPVSFFILRSFSPPIEAILIRVSQRYVSHVHIRPWVAHQWVHHGGYTKVGTLDCLLYSCVV